MPVIVLGVRTPQLSVADVMMDVTVVDSAGEGEFSAGDGSLWFGKFALGNHDALAFIETERLLASRFALRYDADRVVVEAQLVSVQRALIERTPSRLLNRLAFLGARIGNADLVRRRIEYSQTKMAQLRSLAKRMHNLAALWQSDQFAPDEVGVARDALNSQLMALAPSSCVAEVDRILTSRSTMTPETLAAASSDLSCMVEADAARELLDEMDAMRLFFPDFEARARDLGESLIRSGRP